MTDTSAAEPERLTITEVYAAHRLGLVRLATLLVDDMNMAGYERTDTPTG